MIKKLKKIHLIYAVSAKIKSYLTKRTYNNIANYYQHKPSNNIHSLLNQKVGERRLATSKKIQFGNLDIFYLGTDYLQDSSGILQALSKLGNLTYFTNEKGQYGQSPNNESYDEIGEYNSNRLLELFEIYKKENKLPDILIGQMWNGYIQGKALLELKNKYNTIIVNICMDDRHTFIQKRHNNEIIGTAGLIPYIDLACTAAPECVDWYLKEGCPAIFLPEASSPEIFHPMPEKSKLYDVSFAGLKYGIREKVVKALQKAGIKVTVYGTGWESGRIDTKDVPELLARSKIILGVGTVGHCEDLYALKMRDFDAPMSGSFYITHDNKDLHILYDVGKEIVTYKRIDECVEKIRYYLSHDDEREEIAKAGYNRALKDHTWEKRFKMILQIISSGKNEENSN